MQSAEIQEAERLEHEASIRRERAVAHGEHNVSMSRMLHLLTISAGAHPSHGQAGAGTGY